MRIGLVSIVALALLAAPSVPSAQTKASCTREQFGQVVNETGAALRRLSAESQPQVQAALRRLKAKHGWSDEEEERRAESFFSDATGEALDERTTRLLAELDRLADEGGAGTPDCSRLDELRAKARELQDTVRAKSQHMMRKLEAALAEGGAAPTPGKAGRQDLTAAPAPKRPPANSPSAPTAATPPKVAAPAPPPAAASPRATPAPAPWSTSTAPPPPAPPPALTPPVTIPPAPLPPEAASTTYSIDEIQAAARTVFGTVSTSLARVIEHAFARTGRPSGYIVGREGGAAFIAGVRYGRGQLFLKGQPPARIYWHGPSIGYDIGAAGSQTLILVYRITEPAAVFSGFTGIDGSAYLVGGVGVTFLTNGSGIMAPIRSGLGVRFGANIGYIRFTPNATWNPF